MAQQLAIPALIGLPERNRRVAVFLRWCPHKPPFSDKMQTSMQRTLFETAQPQPAISRPSNGFRDSAFARNKGLPVHRWALWIAGFSADFVDDCLSKYLVRPRKNACVLDPFAGVGTTLVEAGRNRKQNLASADLL